MFESNQIAAAADAAQCGLRAALITDSQAFRSKETKFKQYFQQLYSALSKHRTMGVDVRF